MPPPGVVVANIFLAFPLGVCACFDQPAAHTRDGPGRAEQGTVGLDWWDLPCQQRLCFTQPGGCAIVPPTRWIFDVVCTIGERDDGIIRQAPPTEDHDGQAAGPHPGRANPADLESPEEVRALGLRLILFLAGVGAMCVARGCPYMIAVMR